MNLPNMAANRMPLRDLQSIQSAIHSAATPFAKSVLIPRFSIADSVERMMRHFSSESPDSVAPRLAGFSDCGSSHIAAVIHQRNSVCLSSERCRI